MKRAHVGIDDYLGPYPAFVSDARWNGWAVPYFARSAAARIVRDIKAANRRGQTETRASWSGDVIVCEYGEDGTREEFAPVWIRGRQYWPVGSGGWVWSETD